MAFTARSRSRPSGPRAGGTRTRRAACPGGHRVAVRHHQGEGDAGGLCGDRHREEHEAGHDHVGPLGRDRLLGGGHVARAQARTADDPQRRKRLIGVLHSQSLMGSSSARPVRCGASRPWPEATRRWLRTSSSSTGSASTTTSWPRSTRRAHRQLGRRRSRLRPRPRTGTGPDGASPPGSVAGVVAVGQDALDEHGHGGGHLGRGSPMSRRSSFQV